MLSSLRLFFVASCALLAVCHAAPAASPVSSRLSQRLRPLSEQVPSTSQVDQADAAFQSFHAALSEAIVEQVNQTPNTTWTAGMNEYFDGKSYEFLKQSCGTKIDTRTKLGASAAPLGWDSSQLPVYPVPTSSSLPLEFDGRSQWGATCPSVHDIRDQAGCGSCWAVAAAEAMTDRHCISSNGARQPYLSAHHILTCCGLQECGSCEGGYPINAWQYWVSSGVVTGGSYGSVDTCQPYPWEPCEHHTSGNRPQCVAQDTTPACSAECTAYGMDFVSDKSFGGSAYKVASNEESIMNEIWKYGPVEAGFMVYADFPHYKSGIYRHIQGDMVGGHAIKILGWGVESGEKYWLAANSWNTNWGNSGFFKIARGQNECMIEDMIFAGQTR